MSGGAHLRVLPSEVAEPALDRLQRHIITADRQHVNVLDETTHVQEGEHCTRTTKHMYAMMAAVCTAAATRGKIRGQLKARALAELTHH